MNKEDIEKLLGGYASGTLTVEERRQLFAAALEDQDLFDALQEEIALKELLDDPVSRKEIHRAVVDSLPQPKPAWFKQTWFWAAGTSLAAAAVLLAFLVQWKPIRYETRDVAVQRRDSPAPEPAQATPTLRDEKTVAKLEAPKPGARKPAQLTARQFTLKKEESRVASSPGAAPPPTSEPAAIVPPSPPVTPIQAEGRNQTEQVTVQASPATVQQAQTKDGAQSSLSAGVQQQADSVSAFRPQAKAKSAMAGTGSLLAPQVAMRSMQTWSFVKRLTDGSYVNVPPITIFQPGDTIRIAITPRLSGPIELLQLDANTAAWQRLYPPPGLTIQVQAQERYTVPIDIQVKNNDHLRVTIGATAIDIPIRSAP